MKELQKNSTKFVCETTRELELIRKNQELQSVLEKIKLENNIKATELQILSNDRKSLEMEVFKR